jgi:hypothetical protein
MDDDPEFAWLRAQVEQALGDVRRTESVTPAAALGLVVSGVPLLIIFVLTAVRWLL